MTTQLTSEVVAVEDDLPQQVHTEEHDQEDQIMPILYRSWSMFLLIRNCSRAELWCLRYTVYCMAALQLQDCNKKQSQMDDSDYESDYFSDW